jgi:hypothetical protein
MLNGKLEADLLGDGAEGAVGVPKNDRLEFCHEGLCVRTSCREASFEADCLLCWQWQWQHDVNRWRTCIHAIK